LSQKWLGARDDTECKSNLLRISASKVKTMGSREYFEQTATSIAALGRTELQRRIKNFRGRFKLDFTEDYLNNLSVDRLRHILLAALINGKPH
jgi:hypothetical protein